MRPSGRKTDQMRAVSFERNFSKHAEGSCLVKFGDTHVLCTASLEERVPPWLRNAGKGWVTADGGTRTASITGAWIALHDCLKWMEQRSMVKVDKVLKDHVAAISCGIFAGQSVIDLDYLEDSSAETDANFVMTGKGGIVEIQGTAEGEPFSQDEFLTLLDLARNGIGELVTMQKDAIA